MIFYLVIVEEWLDKVEDSRRHFVHLIKNKDILSAGCYVPGNPISQLNLWNVIRYFLSSRSEESPAYLVLFSPPHVREVEGRDEQVDVLAVDAPGVDALRNELRHEVLAAPGPAVEAEH